MHKDALKPRRMSEAVAAIHKTGGLGAFYVGYGTMVARSVGGGPRLRLSAFKLHWKGLP